MRAILHFVRITILGGVLFLTPIVVLGVILNKAYKAAGQIMQPLIGFIPTEVASRTAASAILASLGLALVCFSVGLFARTLWAQRIVNGTRGVGSHESAGLRIPETGRHERPRRRRDGGASGRARAARRRLAHRRANRRSRRGSRRRVRPQLAEPVVGRCVPRRRRPRPACGRPPRRRHGRPQAMRNGDGRVVARNF